MKRRFCQVFLRFCHRVGASENDVIGQDTLQRQEVHVRAAESTPGGD